MEAISAYNQTECSKHYKMLKAQFKTHKFTFKLIMDKSGEGIHNNIWLMLQ
jgi:hypothetical protein